MRGDAGKVGSIVFETRSDLVLIVDSFCRGRRKPFRNLYASKAFWISVPDPIDVWQASSSGVDGASEKQFLSLPQCVDRLGRAFWRLHHVQRHVHFFAHGILAFVRGRVREFRVKNF